MILDFCRKRAGKEICIFGVNGRTKGIIDLLRKNGIHIEMVLQSNGFMTDTKHITVGERDIPIKSLDEIKGRDISCIMASRYCHFNEVIPLLMKNGVYDLYFICGDDIDAINEYDVYSDSDYDLDMLYTERDKCRKFAEVVFNHLL